MSITRFILTLSLTALISACASSGPRISAATQPNIDISAFETFNYMPQLGTDRSNARTPLSNRLIQAMNHEMATRGLRLSDRPDILIDFNFHSRDGLEIRQTPTTSMSMHRSHWNHRYSIWAGHQTTVRQYTEGTFLVDLIDVENAMLIGEAAARGRTLGDLNGMSQEELNTLIADVMAQLLP